MNTPIRMTVEQACVKLKSGDAILVCGYEDEGKFKANFIPGALSYHDFQARLPELSFGQQVIFYCA